MSTYDFRAIEQRWQQFWETRHSFKAVNPGEAGFDFTQPKFYVLDMFPYPSGVGLHVGHPLGYIATDIVARYKRMKGFNVLHPMGFDAFGLPAEQFAVEHGVHPRVTTEQNVANMVRQLKLLGLSYDWSRVLSTTDVDYYRWTQWIFLKLFNSYFDETDQKAKPIADLVQQLENEELFVGPDDELIPAPAEGLQMFEGEPMGARKWRDLDAQQRADVLDEHRLAYLDEVPVNWCPALGTVLANEEVTADGRSERGNHPVYKRGLRQWMLRITTYCERLATELDLVDWPEPIKLMQRNWVGRSEGAMVDFKVDAVPGDEETIRIFTTRPDTLFGATYMVLAPEHPLVEAITTDEQRKDVFAYRAEAAARTDVDRQIETREKTGVFTGAYAINPADGHRVPIWTADYVLMGYGTGAIMAVPAHDERDFAFAKQFHIPIRPVVMPTEKWLTEQGVNDQQYLSNPGALREPFTGDGVAINSANSAVSLNGLTTEAATVKMIDWLELAENGHGKVQYKLRDWLFSRQRYWGEPFPIMHGPDGEIVAVDEKDLPVVLPEMADFSPTSSDDPMAPPRPPLARAPESWRVVVKDGVRYERELNTMPQWAGSCWYYLRFLDAHSKKRFVGDLAEKYWMSPNPVTKGPAGVDLYVGGAEHAVLHLLYARFWHKVLFDLGYVSSPEPFGKLFNQGYIQAYAYTDERGVYCEATKVEETDGKFFYEGRPVTRTLGKMGKSLKNAVSPDEVCAEYGADTLRLYEMYMGPLDASKPWNTRDIVGVHRFLNRVWRNFIDEESGRPLVSDTAPSDDLLRLLHRTIKRVGEDMERMSFNTAIAALIELNNELVSLETLPRSVAEPFILMLAPLAPHIAEEIWSRMGRNASLAHSAYPHHDEKLLVQTTVEIPVQIAGKVRGRITVPVDVDEAFALATAMADEKIAPFVAGKTVRKVIFIPGKMLNIVAN